MHVVLSKQYSPIIGIVMQVLAVLHFWHQTRLMVFPACAANATPENVMSVANAAA